MPDPSSPAGLIEQAELQSNIDPEAARRAAQSALDALAVHPDADLEVRAHLLLCDYFSEHDAAMMAQQSAAASAALARATRTTLRAGILVCQGEIAENAGDLERALTLYDEAVGSANSDEEMLALALSNRGYLRGTRGDYASSLADLRRAQTLYERLSKPSEVASMINSIALIYRQMGDVQESAHLYQSALDIERSAGLTAEQSITLNNLGRAQTDLNDLEGARKSFEDSLAISRQLGLGRMQAYGLRGLAALATAQHDPDSAMRLIDQALELQNATPDEQLRARLLLLRGTALDQLGRPREALTALEQALETFRRTESADELANTYEALATVQAELGDWRTAYDYRRLAQSGVTRMLRNQIDQRFALLKLQYDTAGRERENALLTRENTANEAALREERRSDQLKSGLIAVTVALLLVLAGIVLYLRRMSLRMRSLAMTDELTRVPNRRALLDHIGRLLENENEPTSVLIVDIDHFKTVNDRYGHPIGDDTLRAVAMRLRAAAEPALFGRLGGEEFAVVMANARPDEARAMAEHLRDLAMRIDLSELIGERRLTVSIGIATSQNRGESTTSMLRRADSALYAAKGAGRNCVRLDPLALQGVA